MILSRVKIIRFRCLYSVSVKLLPLTVLIGANDSGKSAFLAALASLFHPNQGGARRRAEDRYRYDAHPEAGPTVRAWSGSHAGIEVIPEGLVAMHQLPSTGIPMVSEGHAEGEGRFPDLGDHGEGVATLLDALLRRDRGRFDRIVAKLRELIPGLEDIRIGTPSPGTRSLELIVEGGLTIQADRASTGLKMMLFFVALAYHPSPPDLVLLEEPENGVHPKRLREIVRLLRSITVGELGGHPAQVVLTTHSPYLLDSIDPVQDQILVFQREADGRRTVEAADRTRLQTFLQEFQLGEVWYNEGEPGLISAK